MWRGNAAIYLMGALLTMRLAGCVGAIEEETADCIESARQAIYNGTVDPDLTRLSAAQQRSVGAIENEYGALLCTGALIHPRWVLTARHCAADDLRFRVAPSGPGAAVARLGAPVRHATLDLALLPITGPSLGVDVTPLAIRTRPVQQLLTPGSPTLLAGVGLQKGGGRGALEFAQEPVVAIEGLSIVVDGDGRTGACTGDSGGPLIGGHTRGRPEIVGMLSKGAASCLGRDSYTRIDTQLGWLTKSIPAHELVDAAVCD